MASTYLLLPQYHPFLPPGSIWVIPVILVEPWREHELVVANPDRPGHRLDLEVVDDVCAAAGAPGLRHHRGLVHPVQACRHGAAGQGD